MSVQKVHDTDGTPMTGVAWVLADERHDSRASESAARMHDFRQGLMLLRACRQINDEASAVLYERNIYIIRPEVRENKAPAWLHRFSDDIGPINRCRKLRIELCLDQLNSTPLIRDEEKYLGASLATLWTVFKLRTLTVLSS
ncbi:MAG: hypothetical protein Q9199_003221 [Rusavskia elegans]